MATSIQHTIDLIIRGEDEATKVLDKVGDRMNSFGSGLQDVFSPFAGAANDVLALNAALGAGTAALIATATQRAGEFSQQMAQINTLTKLDDAGLEAFSDDLLAAAQNLRGGSLGDLQESLYNAVSLGISDYTDALTAATQAEKLAVGGQADLNESLEFLIGTMNSYGAGVEEAERYSDTFFKTVEFGKTTIPELASSMSDISGLASAAAVPIETVGAAISAMTAAGAPTSQAITQIRSALEGMLNPTEGAAKAAAELGVELSASAVKSKGFEGVLQEIYEATGGSVEAMTQLFTSTEGLQAALVLGADKSGTFANALEAMGDKAGATQAAFDEMAEESDAAFQRLVNNIDVALTKAGRKMEGLEGDLVGPLTDLFKGLSDAIDAGSLDGLFDAVKDEARELREFLEGLAEALPKALEGVDFSGLLASLGDLKDSFGGIFDGLDLTTPEGLAEAIQFLVDGAESLVNVGGGIVDAWRPAIDVFSALVGWFVNLDEESEGLAGFFLGFSQQAVIVGGAITAIGTAVSGLSSLFGPAAAAAAAFAGPAALLAISGAAGAAAGSLLRDLVPAVDGAAQGFFGWIDSMVDFSGTAGRANESIEETEARIREEVEAMRALRDETDGAQTSLDTLADTGEINIQATATIDQGLDDFFGELDAVSQQAPEVNVGMTLDEFRAGVDEIESYTRDEDGNTITVTAEADEPAIEQAAQFIVETLPDGSKSIIQVGMDPDQESFDATKDAIDEAVPPEKRMRIETDLQIAEIQAQAKQVEASLQYRAEVDVAEIEAAAEIITTLAEGAADAFSSTGEIIQESLGLLAGLGDTIEDTRARWTIEEALEREADLRERSLRLQEEMARVQNAYIEAKTELMERGEALINVSCDGLVPHLEGMVRSFIEFVQIEATAEGLETLLGLP